MKNALILLFLITSLVACKSQTTQVVKVVDVTTFKKGIAKKDIQLIDVRTPAEFKEGYIEKAILIDFKAENFKTKVQELDKNKPVYLYCRSGKRSALASTILKDLGFNEIVDLEGGYLAWSKKIMN